MKQYFSIFRMKFISSLQYRAAAWAGIATQFFWGFLLIMIYRAFYESSTAGADMTLEELSQYIWLMQSFLTLVMFWSVDSELLENIKSGFVAYDLCRPTDIYKFWFSRILAGRVSAFSLRFAPILIFAFFLPAPIKMQLPPSLNAFFMFLVSITLSVFLVVAISMFIYILTFKTLSPRGSKLIVAVGADFLAGAVIPIPLMNDKLQRIISFLPFKYTLDFPFRIYSGNIANAEAFSGFAIELAWLAFFILAGSFCMKKALKRVVIQGG